MNKSIAENIKLAIIRLEEHGLTGLVKGVGKGDFTASVVDKEGEHYVIMDHTFSAETRDYQEHSVIAQGIFYDMCDTKAYNIRFD